MNALDEVEKLVVATRERHLRNRKIAGIVFAGGTALASWAAIGETSAGSRNGYLILAAIVGALAIGLIVTAFSDPRRLPGLKLLRERSADVVWAYREVGGESDGIYLHLIDRSHGYLPLVDETVMQLAARALPHATIGYSPAYDQMYQLDPRSLTRSA